MKTIRLSGGNAGGGTAEVDDDATETVVDGARYVLTSERAEDGVLIATFAGMAG
jgi:hypothetical protein